MLCKSREVFERTVHLKLSAQKMRFILKRYMAFEKKHGNRALVDAVVEKARAFVDTHKSKHSQEEP